MHPSTYLKRGPDAAGPFTSEGDKIFACCVGPWLDRVVGGDVPPLAFI